MLFGVVLKGTALPSPQTSAATDSSSSPPLPHINDGSRDDGELRSIIGKIVPPHLGQTTCRGTAPTFAISPRAWDPILQAGPVVRLPLAFSQDLPYPFVFLQCPPLGPGPLRPLFPFSKNELGDLGISLAQGPVLDRKLEG